MVKAFHDAGLEVILDVVYNHTAEAGARGPDAVASAGSTTAASTAGCYPTRDRKTSAPAFDDTYWDVTGCGNTVDSSNPLALRMILDSLRYWVTEMHVDGFRFDLMSALTRTGYDIDMHCALLVAIGQDPILRHVKLIAEAVGRLDGRLPGRADAAAVGGVERPVPRHRSATSGAATPRASGPSRPGWPAPRTCTPTTAARRTTRSTS